MNTNRMYNKTLLSLSLSVALLAGCATMPTSPDGAAAVRQQLSQLQADSQLALLAPLAIEDAAHAVALAEQPEKNTALATHRVTMAERKVAIASAQAKTRQLELQRAELSQQRDAVQLNARTLEANLARADASSARTDTARANRQAMLATSREHAALSDARSAHQQADEAQAQAARLRTEMAELNARETDRGVIVTLGDVLFDTGKASLKTGSSHHLDKLARFLNNYPQRSAQIEGHTDDVGSDASNMLLSQRRADTVKAFLVAQGVAGSRLGATGKGEAIPLATNVSAGGRAQNRRVEVIIANPQD
jgi:outer membrane protein OmpA-like peptidoglycan-associated protein